RITLDAKHAPAAPVQELFGPSTLEIASGDHRFVHVGMGWHETIRDPSQLWIRAQLGTKNPNQRFNERCVFGVERQLDARRNPRAAYLIVYWQITNNV